MRKRHNFLLREERLDEALVEARQSFALAPDAGKPNVLVGDILMRLQRPDEARSYYEKALTLSKTVEPEFQVGCVEGLEAKLRQK